MILSSSAPRKLMHTRSVRYAGYQREDGLWDIEAQLTDVKTYAMDAGNGDIPAGTPLHDIYIRVTLSETMEVREVESTFEYFPLPSCPYVTPNYQSLVGLKIGQGWRKAVRERVGGTMGCTHITEILYSLATVAMQTIGHAMSAQNRHTSKAGEPPRRLNNCYSWATDAPAVKKFHPEYYTGT